MPDAEIVAGLVSRQRRVETCDASSGYECKGNHYNRSTYDPVETDGLRLDVQMPDRFSSGLLQWKVE
jgi:hypothetical protein